MHRLLLALLLVLAASSPALAHKLKLFASVIGQTIEGRVYFVGGIPALDVPVTLTDAAGKTLGTTRSLPPEGRFSLPAAAGENLVLTADAEDGHVARFPLSDPASSGDARPTGEAVDTAIARQLAQLAGEVDALRDSLTLRDIIGGIGYLFGLFGLWVLFLRRKSR